MRSTMLRVTQRAAPVVDLGRSRTGMAGDELTFPLVEFSELEENNIMSSYVHIGMYETLRKLGADDESAKAAVADLPIPQHLATKEDIGEVKTEMATLRGEVMRELGIIKWAYVAYGPIIIGLLIKLVFFP